MDVMLVVVTLVSAAVAVTMTVVAWRVVRDERGRREARIAALAADIHGRDVDEVPLALDVGPAPAAAEASMFKARDVGPTGAAIGVGVAVVGAMMIAAFVLSSGSRGASSAKTLGSVQTTDRGPTGAREVAVTSQPLELIALRHKPDGERLIVRGVVRNPTRGTTINHLSVVVSLIHRDGESIGSERAAVDAVTLAPGGETTFALTLPHASEVGRYRVSFRTEQGVLSHVDRRP